MHQSKGSIFFFTKWTGDAQGLQEDVIICRFKRSSKTASSALAFSKLSLLGRKEIGGPSTSRICSKICRLGIATV